MPLPPCEFDGDDEVEDEEDDDVGAVNWNGRLKTGGNVVVVGLCVVVVDVDGEGVVNRFAKSLVRKGLSWRD